MQIIEILALENGAHRNQEYHGKIPPDWGETAFIREDVKTLENFPFGSFEVEEIKGASYMVKGSWKAGEVPEPEPIVEEPTPEEDTAAMLIDHEFRLTLLELGITE